VRTGNGCDAHSAPYAERHFCVDEVLAMSKHAKSTGKSHQFGGEWTTAKLNVLQGYLRSYTIALKPRTGTTNFTRLKPRIRSSVASRSAS